MSLRPSAEPACTSCLSTPAIAVIIDARERDIGGFKVRRLLPSSARRLVGPFIYFDQMGPTVLAPGEGLDVRPHPHIGLATVTYLFDGEIVHRDSLGSHQPIRPGDINWMIAGRGIVHSERTDPSRRVGGVGSHGLQLWVALPRAHEEAEPEFHHHPAATLPVLERGGVRIRLLAGTAFDLASPVRTHSQLFYVDAAMPAGAALAVPPEHEERAVYVAEGVIECGPERAGAGRMLVLAPGADLSVHARQASRIVVLGGAPIDGKRYIWWNFVSSSRERIEQAKRDWKEQRFPLVPGDDVDFVPLPE